jgi:membrane protease YdiL (CAAX protease family)
LPLPSPVAGADRPTRRTPWWLWTLTLVALGALIFMQRPDAPDPAKEAQAAKGLGTIEPPDVSEFALIGKVIIALDGMQPGGPGAPSAAEPLVQVSDQFAGWNTGPLGGPATAGEGDKKASEYPAVDRIRATIVAAEATPAERLAWRLDDIESALDPSSVLRQDVAALRKIYAAPAASGATTAPADLSDAEKDGLIKRHGWFGRLATTAGDRTAPVRTQAASEGWTIFWIMVLAGLVVCVALLAGLVLLVVGLMTWSQAGRWAGGFWRLRQPDPAAEWPAEPAEVARAETAGGVVAEATFLPPAVPKSVWLETLAVFLIGFLAVKLGLEGLHRAGAKGAWLAWAALGAQWLLLPTIFWPVVRGMSWRRWRGEIGWHAGAGVGREIGAGIAGYLAGLPLYFAMAILIVLLTFLWSLLTGGGGAGRAPAGKVFEIAEGGSPAMLVVLYLLATVWAPVVEESIFRGSLYRHLRARLPMVLAGLLTAGVFAALHGYVVQGLFVVGTLGFWFAVIREWRGSIIACATGHAIHNGFVLGLILTLLSFARA